ncbi:serine protease inhibitor 27A-like [Ctenocephalides felis]|uniref:serine protease inhibitor 27A-like n=1 Tax=Ctenocephalides felis TaxID=7515 RepID=UPI000E6E461B|nr:serine protease inhibitor 27A-like [Ctenocephalides felis]
MSLCLPPKLLQTPMQNTRIKAHEMDGYRIWACSLCSVYTPQDTLSISGIMQKAGIEVNEKGSTVYAATEIVLTNKFGNDREVFFSATRPFMFFIQDETSGTILFIGEV